MRFNPADGGTPTQATVKTGTLAAPPQHNPERDGFRFDGWTHDGQPYDFRTPVLQDTTLKAQWSKMTDWTLSPDHGPTTGARVTISPPKTQEPQYASIQAAGEQILGLTGDGHIHTWTQGRTPKQVPSPTQAPDGFHWLQVAASSQRQAALGSDQHIYTWNSQQPEPVTLDTGQDTQFTSISINDDRLLAVDRQGQVHTFQTHQADRQNPNPKPAEQATLSLPGNAQAVNAVASASQALIVDTDGQAWTWDANNTGKAEPERVRQDPDTRILQAQALNQGFLLLNEDGQVYYLADSTTKPTAVSLPEGMKASRITANKNQAIITDRDGKVWAWKPGETPISADNGNQAYTQAVLVGSRITAISRQGDMFTWSLDGQGQPGKPARVNSITAPTLESAGMDGQPLTLNERTDAWQTDIPARQPGQATITITGKQDNQPFTKSLTYTVDQPLTRDIRQGSAYTVHFDTAEGSPTPQDQSIQPVYGRVQRPTPDPTREGFLFDGWFIGITAYDFSKPVTDNITITAHWTPNKQWSISPDKGSRFGHESTTITPPGKISGIQFNQISSGKSVMNDAQGVSMAVGSDGNAYAWGRNDDGQLGDGTKTNRTAPAKVGKPAGTPTDFTYVQVCAGGRHSLAIGSDGYVYAWGRNDYGQLGNNTKSNSSTPVRVHGPGNAGEGLKAIQVSAGAWNSMALAADGTVYTWGSISKGYSNDCSSPQTVPTTVEDPSDASGVFHAVQISTCWSFDMAIGQDGYVYTWGYNTNGQLGNNTSDTTATNIFHPAPGRVFVSSQSTAAAGPWLKAVQVSAGGWHALAIDEDGNTWAWGRNDNGQLGDGKDDDETAPVKVGKPAGTPTDFTYLQFSAGCFHSLALGSDGNAYAWGSNNYGQLGDGTTTNRTTPVKVGKPAGTPADFTYLQFSPGFYHSLTLGSDGNAYAWGFNRYGQLGDNTTNSKRTPVPVAFNPQPLITGVRFDQTPATGLTHGDGSSVTVLTPEHLPGTVTVSVDYTIGGTENTLTDTSLRYTYLPAGVLPQAGGEGILLALATGMTGMGGVLASRRHRREQHQLLHASLE